MATLTVVEIGPGGVDFTAAAVNASDVIPNVTTDERHFLFVDNADTAATTVTVPVQNSTVTVPGYGEVTLSNLSFSVGAGETSMIGPFTAAYINASSQVTVQYSNTTSVTATAFKLPKQS